MDFALFDLAQGLWAGKWLILTCLLAALSIGAVWNLRQPLSYRAESLLQLERRGGGLALPAGMQDLIDTAGSTALGATEIAILRARSVLRRAVQETELDLSATPRMLPIFGNIPARLGLPDPGLALLRPFAWGNEAIQIGALDLPKSLLGQPLTLTRTSAQHYQLTLPSGETLTGQIGARLHHPSHEISLLVTQIDGPIGRQFVVLRQPLDQAIQLARLAFSASETPRNSALLKLGFTAETPQRAERILDAIIRAYIDQNIQRSAIEAQSSLDFIEDQLPLAEAEMARAQEALNRYRQDQNSVDVQYETQTLLEQATSLEAEINSLALQEDELKKRYTANHPTYQSLLETRAALQSRLDRLRAQSAHLPQTQRDIFNLTRSLEVAQQVYLQLLGRAQELRVLRASTVGSVRIVDPAWAADEQVNFGLLRSLAIALLSGLIIGALLTLIRRSLRRGLRSADEIETLGLPVFATIPYSPSAQTQRRRGKLAVLAQSHPSDLAAEALRMLRTTLHFGLRGTIGRSLLLTSAAPAAGKSFTAINLAVITAEAGQRVCLIDADLRRGYLSRYLDDARSPAARPAGLADLLAGTAKLEDVLRQGPTPGLSVIPSGAYPPNPSELLLRPSFAALLAELGRRFDLVLVDSPPALAVTDALIIGQHIGSVLIVARHLETPPAQLAAVRRRFETAGVTLTGAILNGYRPEHCQAADAYASAYRYPSKSARP